MTAKPIPVEDSIERWQRDPAYVAAYEALAEEFARAEMIIAARHHADISQAELARRMGTSQSAIARLESGRVKPSTRTLERLAAATGTRLRIALEPSSPA